MKNIIHKYNRKCKLFLNGINRRDDIVIVLIIILVGLSSFGLGRLSIFEEGKRGVTIEKNSNTASIVNIANPPKESPKALTPGGKFVASKNGSKYHFPWCSGATRMKESNKIWFDSKEEAERAGYTPALNCRGL